MSVGAARPQVAILGARGQVSSGRISAAPARPGIRLVTFGALALYGTLRWSSLISAGAAKSLLGLYVLAMLVAGGRPVLARHSRLGAGLATVIAVAAAFLVAGVPLSWVLHLRIAVIANAIGGGLSTLPQVLVPYSGANQWVRLVIVLGGAVLLLDGALLLAFAPRAMEDLRRAGAALPMVALAAVPTTLVRPSAPYLDGTLLFILLVGFMWGERIGGRRTGGALAVGSVAVIAALFTAPGLDQHKPWIDYRALAGSFAPSATDTFDWSQDYGPVLWPRRGRIVLDVAAKRPEYWKAENLDVFDGQAWTEGVVPGASDIPGPSSRALATWSQAIDVTIRNMKTSDVIGAGVFQPPATLAEPVVQGLSPGTWTTATSLHPGASYTVNVYAADPSPAQLKAAGADYAGVPAGYFSILLPAGSVPALANTAASPQIVFPPFHSSGPIQNVVGLPITTGQSIIEASPYEPAYKLARRLAAGSRTPYQFAAAVERWLARGYTYGEDPPRLSYPLEGFLFETHLGYCQQFAGAMALLLRMGGVPARVAVGFTPGRQDPATHRWLVSDLDAHAWVEAWFPLYGWVRFDPTPASDPALGGATGLPNLADQGPTTGATRPFKRVRATSAPSRGAPRNRRHRAGGGGGVALPAIGVLAGVAVLGLILLMTRPLQSADALVIELERAMWRTGRRLPGGATLAWLERRVAGSSEAAAYVRTLSTARFAGAAGLPTRAQRRALRRQLRAGLGPLATPRAVWALPPRWATLRIRSKARREP